MLRMKNLDFGKDCLKGERSVSRVQADLLKLGDVNTVIDADSKAVNELAKDFKASLIKAPEPFFDKVTPLVVNEANFRKLNRGAKEFDTASYKAKAKAVENAGIDQMNDSVPMMMLIWIWHVYDIAYLLPISEDWRDILYQIST